MLQDLGLIAEFSIDIMKLQHFLETCSVKITKLQTFVTAQKTYKQNPYHNFKFYFYVKFPYLF